MPRFISPNTGAPETVLAEDQLDYLPVSVAHYVDTEKGVRIMAVRISFSDKERLAIAEGEDIYITQLMCAPDQLFTPMDVLVGPQYLTVKEG